MRPTRALPPSTPALPAAPIRAMFPPMGAAGPGPTRPPGRRGSVSALQVSKMTTMAASGFRVEPGDGLLLVDVQNDFLPGGSLAVADGDRVVAPLRDWAARFAAAGAPIFATRDWHPADHCSFSAQGGPWPPHCVAGTPGAAFADGLGLPPTAVVVSKAMRDDDAYSGFEGTDLHERLKRAGVRRLCVGGLATDYCVLNSVLDARRLGYAVVLLADCIRAVEVQPGDGTSAIAAMRAAGAVILEG